MAVAGLVAGLDLFWGDVKLSDDKSVVVDCFLGIVLHYCIIGITIVPFWESVLSNQNEK